MTFQGILRRHEARVSHIWMGFVVYEKWSFIMGPWIMEASAIMSWDGRSTKERSENSKMVFLLFT